MTLTEEDLHSLPGNGEGIDPDNPGKYAQLLADLQGNILNSHGRDYSVHLFLQFKPGKINEAKKWIQTFAQQYLTSAKQQAESARRFREQGIDVVIMADDNLVSLLQKVNTIVQGLRQAAEIIHREDGFILKNSRGQFVEHFGFVDNISQPLFLKREIELAKKRGSDFSKWDPRASLDLILVKDPNGKTEDSYGTYLVYRKLEQNVKGFREGQRKLSQKLNVTEDLAGALVVGRFFDGTPVTLRDQPLYANPIRPLDR